MRIIIGVTSGWEPGTVVEGWPMVYVNKGLTDCLEAAGAIPVIIPVLEDEKLMNDYMDIVDGVIVSGEILSVKRNVVKDLGTNILQGSNPLRYKNEYAAIQAAKKAGKPLLGICRGHQVLTVVEGGSVGDRDINEGNEIMHQQGGVHLPNVGVHWIRVTPGSTLASMLKDDAYLVNSFHRQPVERAPDGFRVAAVTDDGNIEAIEADDNRFCMGVQFHPEMLPEPIWHQFFSEFVNIVRKSKATR